MTDSLYAEINLFAVAFMYGIAIIFVYDIIRILRRIVKHGNVLVALEDMAFWIGVTILIFRMLFYQNDGALRIYIILAEVAGMFTYSLTLSRYVVKYVSKGINKIFKYLLKPLKFIAKTIKIIFTDIRGKLKEKRQAHIKRAEEKKTVKEKRGKHGTKKKNIRHGDGKSQCQAKETQKSDE